MRIRYAGKMWDVGLYDDGTLDTVISVTPCGNSTRPLRAMRSRNKAEAFICSDCFNRASEDVREGCTPAAPRRKQNCDVCGLTPFEYRRQELRFDGEYAAQYRRPSGEMTMRGLRILGQEAAEAYDAAELD